MRTEAEIRKALVNWKAALQALTAGGSAEGTLLAQHHVDALEWVLDGHTAPMSDKRMAAAMEEAQSHIRSNFRFPEQGLDLTKLRDHERP